MDINVSNEGADSTLVFASGKDYRRSNITSYLPKLADMLSVLRDMELFSKEYMSYVSDIVAYIRVSLQPELQFIGQISSGHTNRYTDYAAPRFLYAISMINPTNLTISVNKLDVLRNPAMKGASVINSLFINMYDVESTSLTTAAKKLSSKLSSIFAAHHESGTPTLEDTEIPIDDTTVVIGFPLRQYPYRRIEINTKNLKNELVTAYKTHAALVTESSEKTNSAWKKTIIFLIIITIIVAIIGVLCGGALTLSRSGNQYEERHITNVNYS
jgi:hypothetical protein